MLKCGEFWPYITISSSFIMLSFCSVALGASGFGISTLSILDRDTGFEAICCVCMEFKSRTVCKYVLPGKLTKAVQEKHCYQTDASRNIDGHFYICNECHLQIKAKKIPPKSQRDLFQLSKFPEALLKQIENVIGNVKDKHLNKLEQFILKLVIPFIRVAHCKRQG